MKRVFRPSPVTFLVALVLWAVIATAVFLATSCASSSDLVEKSDTPPAMAELGVDEPAAVRGLIRRQHGRQVCQTSHGYLPYICFEEKPPRVNQWHLLTGVVGVGTSTKTPREIQAAWIVGHQLLESPLEHFAAPGCQLLVQPITILLAPHERPQPNDRIGAWSQGEVAYLLIRPAPATLGQSIFVQLAVLEPGHNAAGVIGSGFAVELVVGS